MKPVFIKYPSIENLYIVQEDAERLAQLQAYDGRWIVTEKIDGCNLSFLITKDEIAVASRNAILPESGHELYSAVQNTEHVRRRLTEVQNWIRDNPTSISQVTLFGEYFGAGIQNRVYYGEYKNYRIFDVAISGRGEQFFCSPYEAVDALARWRLLDLYVPILATTRTLDEALRFPNAGQSHIWQTVNLTYSPIPQSEVTDEPPMHSRCMMEGVVIRPWEYPEQTHIGYSFDYVIKSKNEAFLESQRHGVKKYDAGQPIVALHNEFVSLLTENRMYSVFSKLGAPQTRRDIGKYIGAYVEDAKAEFERQHRLKLNGYSEEDKRYIFSTGRTPYIVFKAVAQATNCTVEF